MALTDKLSAIGDAIREKTGGVDLLTLDEMPAEIESISGGGDIPDEALALTGNCSYKFANNGWNWFIDEYGDQITTSNITDASYMFINSSIRTNIPFALNISNGSNNCSISFLFSGCNQLKSLPPIVGRVGEIQAVFQNCRSLREIPNSFAEGIDWSGLQNSTSYVNSVFYGCYSLRRIAPNFIANVYSRNSSSTRSVYSSTFSSCYCLDEISSLPVMTITLTSNLFSSTFNSCGRVKGITFVTDDGTPLIATWKNQVVNLTNSVGYTSGISDITSYNSGITSDKQVTNDTAYEALKNDPDWFTSNVAYSRYNHDSAVETINSLPDTSAYLATAGGTNTIKFKGASGSATDGGAINTLTEAEIAVATAKGWTVSLV